MPRIVESPRAATKTGAAKPSKPSISPSSVHRALIHQILEHPRVWVADADNHALPGGLIFPSYGFVYATMVYGKVFSRYIDTWVEHFVAATGETRRPLVLFTLDEAAERACQRTKREHPLKELIAPQLVCVRGGIPGIMNKFLIPWVLTVHGIDVVWVDFDVYFFQDPTLHILEHQQARGVKNEILISGSFSLRFGVTLTGR